MKLFRVSINLCLTLQHSSSLPKFLNHLFLISLKMDTYQFHRCPILRRDQEVSPRLDNFIFLYFFIYKFILFFRRRGLEMITRSNIQAIEIVRFIWLHGVLNAFVAIIPLPLHVDVSNVSNIKIC